MPDKTRATCKSEYLKKRGDEKGDMKD